MDHKSTEHLQVDLEHVDARALYRALECAWEHVTQSIDGCDHDSLPCPDCSVAAEEADHYLYLTDTLFPDDVRQRLIHSPACGHSVCRQAWIDGDLAVLRGACIQPATEEPDEETD